MQAVKSQQVRFQGQEFDAYTNRASHGARAKEISQGADWAWLEEFVLKAIEDEAVMVLRNSRSEEDRVKAQQMFLAAEKPRKILEGLISQGDAARAALAELVSTLDTTEEK